VSLVDRLRRGLRRTTDQLFGRLDTLTSERRRSLDSGGGPEATASIDTLEALEEILIEADLGVVATNRLIDAARGHVDGRDLLASVKGELCRLLDFRPMPSGSVPCPKVVLVVGVNGTGKTTTVGRLARLAIQEGQRPVICAADTFRAAAVEQLRVWAQHVDAEFVSARAGADPAAVVFDAITCGKARQCDIVLVDTAGRLHTQVNLMGELDKIRRVAGRAISGAPHETLLVLDATVGQNGLHQARKFLESSGVTGIVLTKLDGTAKGGIVAAITADLGLPIRYIGVGEQLDDLLPFSATDYVDALFRSSW